MSGPSSKAPTPTSEPSSPTSIFEDSLITIFGTPADQSTPIFPPRSAKALEEDSLLLEPHHRQQRLLEDLLAAHEGDLRDSYGQPFFVVEPRVHDDHDIHERAEIRPSTRRSLSDPGLLFFLDLPPPNRHPHIPRGNSPTPVVSNPIMAQPADNTPKPKEVSPPTLADVDPIKWVTFSKQFTRVANLNNWDKKRSKLLLHTCMQDAAARAVEHIEFDDNLSLEDAIQRFAKIFVNPASTQLYKQKFKEASRQPGEELILWHTRAREMFMRAYPKENDQENNEDLKERFVLGLRNRQLSHSLLSAENYSAMTFTEVLTRAQNLQGSLMQCQKTYADVNAINPSSSTSVSALSSGATGKKSSNVICYHCDKPGHVLKECRSFERARARIAKNPSMLMTPLDQQNRPQSTSPGNFRGMFRGRTQHPRGNFSRGRSRGFGHSRGSSTTSPRGSMPYRPPRNTYPGGLSAIMADDDLAASLMHDAPEGSSTNSLDNSVPPTPNADSSSSTPVFSEN